jgi:molybdopterin/thiamine biosynthesis adenylyltransferase
MPVPYPDPYLREIHLESSPSLETARRLDPDQRLPEFLSVARGDRNVGHELDVLAIGAGSVGLAEIESTTHVGPRSITIVDPARFKVESLSTHSTITHREIGRSKALVAAERAKAASPRTRVLAFDGPFEALPISIAAHAGVWLLATDNLRVELRVAQAALHLGRPVIQGSVWGPGLIAQIRSLAASPDGSGPSLCCAYAAAEWDQADAGTVFSCAGSPEPDKAWAPSQVPTRSVAALCATAGSLMSLELIRRRLGIGDPEASQIMEFRGYDLATTVTPLRRRAQCPLDHQRMELLPERDGLGQRTPRELLERSGYAGADPHRVTFTIPGHRFAKLTACQCAAHALLERFVAAGTAGERCSRCQALRAPHPLYDYDEVPAAVLGSRLDHSFASLGAGAPGSVRVRGDRGACLVYRSLPEAGVPQELAS